MLAVSPCMLLLAEPRQLLCCPDPSPGTGFQSHSAELSWAGSDRGSAKVCQSGGPVGGLGSDTCMVDLTWAGGDTPEPLAAASMAPPWASDCGICTPFPKPPLCLCSWQQGPPHPARFSCLVSACGQSRWQPPCSCTTLAHSLCPRGACVPGLWGSDAVGTQGDSWVPWVGAWVPWVPCESFARRN